MHSCICTLRIYQLARCQKQKVYLMAGKSPSQMEMMKVQIFQSTARWVHLPSLASPYLCSVALQRRAVRSVCGIYEQKAPITDTQTALGWDTLEQIRLKSVVTMGYKIVNNVVAVPSTQLKPSTRGTRGNGKKFHQIYAGTNY